MNMSIMADWGQTRYIAHHPDQYSETFNPLLRGDPSIGKVDVYFLAGLMFHNGVMIALPKKHRPYYAGAVMAVETYFVISNNQIGIKVDF